MAQIASPDFLADLEYVSQESEEFVAHYKEMPDLDGEDLTAAMLDLADLVGVLARATLAMYGASSE